MASFHYQQLRTDAHSAIDTMGKAATKLVLLHAGVSLGLSLAITAINYVVDLGIAQTGGLGGMDARTVLETIQTLLVYVQTIALPFWEMGYLFAVLRMARRQGTQNADLLAGFRYFGPVLRATVLRWVIYFALMMVGAQIGSLLFMLTPASQDMLQFSQQLVGAETLDYGALLESEEYMSAMLPAVPFMLGGMVLPLIPVYYRLRMMDYAVMDEPRKGALHALVQSIRMTRKKCWALFKLDLHFWWFYLLQFLTVALCYGDILLPLMGVELSMNADLAMYVFYALALIAELCLYVWRKNQVYTTYALVYDDLRTAEPVPQPKPAPKNVPWNY